MTTAPCDLRGRGVLVTRPAAQAQPLCERIAAAGGRAVCFPTMEIVAVADPAPAAQLLAQSWDLMFFSSRNAVEHARALFPHGCWPQVGRVAAVGRATANALEACGRAPDLMPQSSYDSETMLQLPELADVSGLRVLLVRGEGGRQLMAETLRARGAEVHVAEVYRRVCPEANVAPLLRSWESGIDLVTATSNEVLENLVAMLGAAGHERLLATPLAVIATRTEECARKLGFRQVVVAERADDDSLLAALCRLVTAASA